MPKRLAIGETIANGTFETQLGKIEVHELLKNRWAIFVALESTFNPMNTTEIGHLAKLKDEFEGRNAMIFGICPTAVGRLELWIEEINETQRCEVTFPIICDQSGRFAQDCGLLTSKGSVTNAVFIVSPSLTVASVQYYPEKTGRNFYEMLRILDSLQLCEYYKACTPCHWKNGDEVIVHPTVPKDLETIMFPKGVTAITSVNRVTPQPDIPDDIFDSVMML
eukprot:TRINITY_DN776051_c0_g1_i1.p1 TRINITY_DN776051_c0_g1~~TRINITY_DN776051_c0_g1_i1.p1  ORF type:complete len:222 (+),score=46.05 TRINITY_DN776051_c0_g1_i1:162-827(+)